MTMKQRHVQVQEVTVEGDEKPEDSRKDKTPPEHLYKYEVEETEPDDEEMVELHVIEADDIKREKGLFTR